MRSSKKAGALTLTRPTLIIQRIFRKAGKRERTHHTIIIQQHIP